MKIAFIILMCLNDYIGVWLSNENCFDQLVPFGYDAESISRGCKGIKYFYKERREHNG